MESNPLFTNIMTLLKKTLDFRSQRHNLIASNIANIDTPRFQAKDLQFKDQLRDALLGAKSRVIKTTHKRHFPIGTQDMGSVTPEVVSCPSVLLSNDLNTVDAEKEMGKLVENNLMYNIAARILKKKFEGIKNVIRDGGGCDLPEFHNIGYCQGFFILGISARCQQEYANRQA